jgi:hypothetical protein
VADFWDVVSNDGCASRAGVRKLTTDVFRLPAAEPRLRALSYRPRHKQKYATAPDAKVSAANGADIHLITSVMAEDLIEPGMV